MALADVRRDGLSHWSAYIPAHYNPEWCFVLSLCNLYSFYSRNIVLLLLVIPSCGFYLFCFLDKVSLCSFDLALDSSVVMSSRLVLNSQFALASTVQGLTVCATTPGPACVFVTGFVPHCLAGTVCKSLCYWLAKACHCFASSSHCPEST